MLSCGDGVGERSAMRIAIIKNVESNIPDLPSCRGGIRALISMFNTSMAWCGRTFGVVKSPGISSAAEASRDASHVYMRPGDRHPDQTGRSAFCDRRADGCPAASSKVYLPRSAGTWRIPQHPAPDAPHIAHRQPAPKWFLGSKPAPSRPV